MTPQPIALPPVLPSELLTWVLSHQAYPTTLIVCKPRTVFLESLLQCIPQYMANQPALIPEDLNSDEPVGNINDPPGPHPLLTPTLRQVATSRYISLVFIPSLSHLRAYLAVFPLKASVSPPDQKFQKPGRRKPLLVVYGIVELHRDTSEWSAQGVGHSIAGLVEAGIKDSRKIVIMEERKLDENIEVLGDEPPEEVSATKNLELFKVWEERIPMLNGSVRRTGFESEDGGWSGRTVEIGRVLGRWFKFRSGN